jgi:hypothetical protein
MRGPASDVLEAGLRAVALAVASSPRIGAGESSGASMGWNTGEAGTS